MSKNAKPYMVRVVKAKPKRPKPRPYVVQIAEEKTEQPKRRKKGAKS